MVRRHSLPQVALTGFAEGWRPKIAGQNTILTLFALEQLLLRLSGSCLQEPPGQGQDERRPQHPSDDDQGEEEPRQ